MVEWQWEVLWLGEGCAWGTQKDLQGLPGDTERADEGEVGPKAIHNWRDESAWIDAQQ